MRPLPGPKTGPLVKSAIAGLPLLRYRLGGEENLVKERIAKTIAVLGDEGLDIEELVELVLYDLRERRGVNLRALLQHQAAVATTRSRDELLQTLAVPTLVIHGTTDILLPIEHGERLVELIPGARHLWLDGVGHQFPYPDMSAVLDAVISHLDRSG